MRSLFSNRYNNSRQEFYERYEGTFSSQICFGFFSLILCLCFFFFFLYFLFIYLFCLFPSCPDIASQSAIVWETCATSPATNRRLLNPETIQILQRTRQPDPRTVGERSLAGQRPPADSGAPLPWDQDEQGVDATLRSVLSHPRVQSQRKTSPPWSSSRRLHNRQNRLRLCQTGRWYAAQSLAIASSWGRSSPTRHRWGQ